MSGRRWRWKLSAEFQLLFSLHFKSLPLPNPPLGCAKGREQSLAPSLARSAGEGWGGVLLLQL